MREASIHIVGDRVRVERGRTPVLEAPLETFVRAVAQAAARPASCGVLPKGVRVWVERRDAVALAVEIPPHARTVRWLAQDSRTPFGRGAKYETWFLAFPYVVLLLVLRQGELTNMQQLYYRREPLEAGEELLLPNLYNVAEGYGQRCWVCLQHVTGVGALPWPRKIETVTDHVFSAAFNRSSERHEGNSWWSAATPVDPRVASPEAWQAASRANPWFALDLPWRPADTSVSAELGAMLDRVVAPSGLRDAADLSGLLLAARGEDR